MKLRSPHRLDSHVSGIMFIACEHFTLASDTDWLCLRLKKGVPQCQPKGSLALQRIEIKHEPGGSESSLLKTERVQIQAELLGSQKGKESESVSFFAWGLGFYGGLGSGTCVFSGIQEQR